MGQVCFFESTCTDEGSFIMRFVADGMYGNFAGRDASRGMAKQSFDECMF